MTPGDYVVVVTGVWDGSMPEDRRDGIVLETTGPKFAEPDQATVLFCNGTILKFHKSQLTLLKTKEDFYL